MSSTPGGSQYRSQCPEDSYRLCYIRGPEGINVELAEQISERSVAADPRPTKAT